MASRDRIPETPPPPRDLSAELDGWIAPGVSSAELLGRIIAHPQFAAAACALAISSLETIRAGGNQSHASVDAGRYVAKVAVMWLDGRGELTLPALKRLCAESGLLSAGRARDCLAYLLHIGFVEQTLMGRGARPSCYQATDRFRADWIAHLRGPIAAAALIAPAAGDLLDRMNDPAVAATFIDIQGGALLRSAKTLPSNEPVVETFYHPAGGLQLLNLLIAGAADRKAFPSRHPVKLPLATTAQVIGVSVLQLKRVLASGTSNGLLAASSGSSYALTEKADPPLRFIYAGQLLQLLDPVARTFARLQVPARP